MPPTPSPLARYHQANQGLLDQTRRRARERAPGMGLPGGTGGRDDGASAGIYEGGNRADAESYALFKQWVYVATTAIAKRLAHQPIIVAEHHGEDGGSRAAPTTSRKTARAMTREEWNRAPRTVRAKARNREEYEILRSHGIYDLMERPNPHQRKWEFLYFSALQLLLPGECFWIGGETNGKLELWAVPSTWMRPAGKNWAMDAGDGRAPTPIPAENVARTYFPDPSDPRKCHSPLKAILKAARTDDYIQESQEQAFAGGIFPNLVVTIGRTRGQDGKLTDRRPTLNGPARRQVIRAIRQVWAQSTAAGDPAIIDGLIESIHKLNYSPSEMDWLQSGEIVKKRIMQAYNVNPIVVGEVPPASKAQAVVANQQMCDQAVNPIGVALGETLNEFVTPWFEEDGGGEDIEAWIDPCVADDAEAWAAAWEAARDREDVSRNEYRTEVLGLPPLPDEQNRKRNELLETPAGIAGVVQVLGAVSAGQISREQAALIFETFYELEPAQAAALADGPEAPPPPPALPAPPPPSGSDDETDDETGTPPAEPLTTTAAFDMLCRSLATTLRRENVQQMHAKQAGRLESEAASQLASHFPANG